MSLGELLKKTWHFLWHSDSVLSWLVNIVLAFVLIKFIIYPGLGLLFATPFPIVAVVSGSMEHMVIDHDGNTSKFYKGPHLCGNYPGSTDLYVPFDDYWDSCGTWYEQRNITKDQFSTFDFKQGFNKGDIIFIYGTDPKNLKIGDVIVFQTTLRAEPIIHRIVKIQDVQGNLLFTTKGDHNANSDPVIDTQITESQILGKGTFRVPFLGWAKIWFVGLIQLFGGI